MVTFWIYFEELTGSAEGLDMREVRDIGESRRLLGKLEVVKIGIQK